MLKFSNPPPRGRRKIILAGPTLETLDFTIHILALNQPFYISIFGISTGDFRV